MTVAISAALDAFYLEHRLCGELESGVEDLDGGAKVRVWIRCSCGASGAWLLLEMA